MSSFWRRAHSQLTAITGVPSVEQLSPKSLRARGEPLDARA